ncbi:hypothetical protein [Clostridium ihumii]|nr:hypothetical protein [Clostridium ihumii]
MNLAITVCKIIKYNQNYKEKINVSIVDMSISFENFIHSSSNLILAFEL